MTPVVWWRMGLIPPDLDGHAVKALGRLRASASRSALESRIDDKRAWVGKEARRSLAKRHREDIAE